MAWDEHAAASVHAPIHPSRVWFTTSLAIGSVIPLRRALGLGWCHLHGHRGTESPFAAWESDPAEGRVHRSLERGYPALIAPMGACASPPPSPVLRTVAWSVSLGRLPRAPCWAEVLPAVLSSIA